VYTLKHSKCVDLENQFDILVPYRIDVTSKWNVMKDFGSRENHIVLLSKDGKKVIKGIRIGQGPNEVTGPEVFCTVVGDRIVLIDYNGRKQLFVEAVGDSLKVVDTRSLSSLGALGLQLLTESKALQVTFMDSVTFLKLANISNGEVLSTIGYPHNPALSEFSGMVQNTVYGNSFVAVSPDCSHFAYSVGFSEQYGFGRIVDDKLIMDKEYVYSPIKIKDVVGGRVIIPAKDNRINSVHATGTSKYAIFAYSGNDNRSKALSNIILIYSWDGNPKALLKLDKKVNSVAYDGERNVLVAVSDDEGSYYLEYDLNGVIGL
jgi:hypothetical protein